MSGIRRLSDIRTVSKEQAEKILERYGHSVLLWTTCSMDNGRYQVLLIDNGRVPGFARVFGVAVYELDRSSSGSVMLERFNVRY